MDPRSGKAHDSLKITVTEGTSSSKDEVSFSFKELWRFVRIRDFICLLLSYPIKLSQEEKDAFKAWTDAFHEWKALLLSNKSKTILILQTEKALRCMEGLIPIQIISELVIGKIGIRSLFINYDKYLLIPRPILCLSVDLAVEQLIRTLFSGDYYASSSSSSDVRYVKLSTSYFTDKKALVKKFKIALEDKQLNLLIGTNGKDFTRSHSHTFWIDASVYDSDVKVVRVQEKIDMIEMPTSDNRYLVILVDNGDNFSGKIFDPRKVHFPAGKITVVLITTTDSSSMEEGDDEIAITCAMDLNIKIEDHLLPWEILCSYTGNRVIRSSRAIQKIAVKIVEKCRGHLLAIILVAKSLLLKHVEEVKQWELALNKLSYDNPSFDYQQSDDGIVISRVMVNAFVNLVWENINERQKFCLELILFVPEIKIGVPWKMLMSILIDSTNIELDYTREYAEDDILDLLDRFVLLPRKNSSVRLPVECYDIIESLQTLNPSIIRHGALGLTEPPYIGRWHGLIRIELMDNKITKLPQSPDCPKLQVLFLQGNADLMDIPDTFFNHMPLLQHLDLSYTGIRDLPSSLSKLIKLKKFYIRGCDLFMKLPQNFGQLECLEELDLDGTLITHLPEETRKLINLQRLTLCFGAYCDELGDGEEGEQTIIPPGVISDLTQLNY